MEGATVTGNEGAPDLGRCLIRNWTNKSQKYVLSIEFALMSVMIFCLPL